MMAAAGRRRRKLHGPYERYYRVIREYVCTHQLHGQNGVLYSVVRHERGWRLQLSTGPPLSPGASIDGSGIKPKRRSSVVFP